MKICLWQEKHKDNKVTEANWEMPPPSLRTRSAKAASNAAFGARVGQLFAPEGFVIAQSKSFVHKTSGLQKHAGTFARANANRSKPRDSLIAFQDPLSARISQEHGPDHRPIRVIYNCHGNSQEEKYPASCDLGRSSAAVATIAIGVIVKWWRINLLRYNLVSALRCWDCYLEDFWKWACPSLQQWGAPSASPPFIACHPLAEAAPVPGVDFTSTRFPRTSWLILHGLCQLQ